MTPPLSWPVRVFDWLAEKHWHQPEAWLKERPAGHVKVLVAGCGTGKWLTHFARHFAGDADVWAVDLSLSSLSFASRKAAEAGIQNVKFIQADILAMPAIITQQAPFDFIEAGGMLHHLKEPLEGWQKLVSLLRPGGAMLVALYSRIARTKHVDPCRQFAKQGRYIASDSESLRKFRTDVFDRADAGDKWAKSIIKSGDFASLHGLRDLCFHIQETQYILPEIKKMLQTLNLEWLQMAETVSDEKQKLFEQKMGAPAFSLQANMEKWHDFEKMYPTTFMGMYEFFVQSCPGNICREVRS